VARDPHGVAVRGVDEVSAPVDVGVERRERGAVVGGPAEDVAAQAQRVYVETGVGELRDALRLAARCQAPDGLPGIGESADTAS
jgi:hypothetical protein